VVVAVVVAVAVAGVIFVGHGHGDVYVNDHDHQPTLPLGASVRPGKESLSAAFCDVAALVAGLGRPGKNHRVVPLSRGPDSSRVRLEALRQSRARAEPRDFAGFVAARRS
jgi:hypothetical protein